MIGEIHALIGENGSGKSTAGNQLETQIMIALLLGGMPVNGGAKVRFYNINYIITGVFVYHVRIYIKSPALIEVELCGSQGF